MSLKEKLTKAFRQEPEKSRNSNHSLLQHNAQLSLLYQLEQRKVKKLEKENCALLERVKKLTSNKDEARLKLLITSHEKFSSNSLNFDDALHSSIRFNGYAVSSKWSPSITSISDDRLRPLHTSTPKNMSSNTSSTIIMKCKDARTKQVKRYRLPLPPPLPIKAPMSQFAQHSRLSSCNNILNNNNNAVKKNKNIINVASYGALPTLKPTTTEKNQTNFLQPWQSKLKGFLFMRGRLSSV